MILLHLLVIKSTEVPIDLLLIQSRNFFVNLVHHIFVSFEVMMLFESSASTLKLSQAILLKHKPKVIVGVHDSSLSFRVSYMLTFVLSFFIAWLWHIKIATLLIFIKMRILLIDNAGFLVTITAFIWASFESRGNLHLIGKAFKDILVLNTGQVEILLTNRMINFVLIV
jgi:hypothetical protein